MQEGPRTGVPHNAITPECPGPWAITLHSSECMTLRAPEAPRRGNCEYTKGHALGAPQRGHPNGRPSWPCHVYDELNTGDLEGHVTE